MASPILEEPTDTGYGAPRRRAMASTARRAAAKLRFVSPYSNQAPKRRSSGRKF